MKNTYNPRFTCYFSHCFLEIYLYFRSLLLFMKYRVILEPDEDGMIIASVPALPGCISQGESRMEAVNNIRDAVQGYVASLKKHGEPVPPSIDEEIIEVG